MQRKGWWGSHPSLAQSIERWQSPVHSLGQSATPFAEGREAASQLKGGCGQSATAGGPLSGASDIQGLEKRQLQGVDRQTPLVGLATASMPSTVSATPIACREAQSTRGGKATTPFR